ncbi:MAG: hypothetical protein JSW73_00440 [Candidatus Woesearchaeota archaeon]|nr:MAG: hypothetical protein JSW73_00440 [Candidatus Woesearchaeota archaeon]
MKIYTNAEKFLEDIGADFLETAKTLNTVEEVHKKISSVLKCTISLDDFITEIGDIMCKKGEGMSRPKRGMDLLSPSLGRGMDALSTWLIKRKVSESDYKKIIAFSHKGYLEERYRNYKWF